MFVLALGLIVRTLFISLHERPLISDEKEYDQLAFSIASLSSYSYGENPTAYRPVGYPALVGVAYFVLGRHSIAVKFAQGFLDVGTAFLIFLLLAPYSRRTGVLGALLWVLFPPAILYTNFLMTETTFTFLLTLAVVLMLRGAKDSIGFILLLGITLGMLILMKPGALLFLLIPAILYRKLQFSRTALVATLATALLVITPWSIRNYVTFGDISLSSNGGINFLIGNHPGTNGAYNLTFDPSILEGASNEFEVESRASHYATRYITHHPDMFLINAVKKLAHLFESEGGILVWSFHPHPEDTSIRFASKYQGISPLLSLLTNLPYMLLMFVGIFGFVSAKKDSTWWVFVIMGGIWLGIHILFFGGSRFHFPMMPFVLCSAALALANPLSTFKGLTSRQLVSALIVASALLALWMYEGFIILNA
jgi:4-amino-4-deoxy-L-arabinose transferase-like glycosyltransferase